MRGWNYLLGKYRLINLNCTACPLSAWLKTIGVTCLGGCPIKVVFVVNLMQNLRTLDTVTFAFLLRHLIWTSQNFHQWIDDFLLQSNKLVFRFVHWQEYASSRSHSLSFNKNITHIVKNVLSFYILLVCEGIHQSKKYMTAT